MHAQTIAVAGATGRLGSNVVELLEAAGHTVRPMSRTNGVDVITTEGLADALAGVDCIIDASSGPSPDERDAIAFFSTSARNLHTAGAAAGVRRLVIVSIIGCERFAGGYMHAKHVHEREALAGPLSTRVLRATQFHELVGQLVDWGTRDGVVHVPAMRTQLIAARAVAQAAVNLALEGDGEQFAEVAGPQEERLVDAARLLVESRSPGTPVEEIAATDDPDDRLYVDGALLPSATAHLAGPSYGEWLRAAPAER